MLVYQTKYRSQSTQFRLFRSISARSHSQKKKLDFYSDIRIFSGGFTAAKIRLRIRLADFFSTDIRRTKIRRLIRIFGGGLGVKCCLKYNVTLCRQNSINFGCGLRLLLQRVLRVVHFSGYVVDTR